MSLFSEKTMFEQQKKDFINAYFRMFPTFFNEKNEAINEWVISLEGAFKPFENKKIDWNKLREEVFSLIADPYKPLMPGKWKDKIAECVIPDEQTLSDKHPAVLYAEKLKEIPHVSMNNFDSDLKEKIRNVLKKYNKTACFDIIER